MYTQSSECRSGLCPTRCVDTCCATSECAAGSICRLKGSLLAAFEPDLFHLETSRDDIAVYTFGKHVIHHQFCKTCGCAPFSEGTWPDGTPMVAINLRCAEGIDLSTIKITPFDGASL